MIAYVGKADAFGKADALLTAAQQHCKESARMNIFKKIWSEARTSKIGQKSPQSMQRKMTENVRGIHHRTLLAA